MTSAVIRGASPGSSGVTELITPSTTPWTAPAVRWEPPAHHGRPGYLPESYLSGQQQQWLESELGRLSAEVPQRLPL